MARLTVPPPLRRAAPLRLVLVALAGALTASALTAPALAAQAPPRGATRPPTAADFAGRWEHVSDDGTEAQVVELEADGGVLTGTIAMLSRGYYSGRTDVQLQLALRGEVRGSTLRLSIWDPQGSPQEAASGIGYLRNGYLVLRAAGRHTGFARPGTPLVVPADGSAEAAALERAVTGRVYSAGSQASGRGATVGGRLRLALCADGRVELDASDLASTPGAGVGGGVDMGGAVARRGAWDVVLLAGAPAVRARWQGTGSTYSLTAYFAIEPAADGRSAEIDGTVLPVTGRC